MTHMRHFSPLASIGQFPASAVWRQTPQATTPEHPSGCLPQSLPEHLLIDELVHLSMQRAITSGSIYLRTSKLWTAFRSLASRNDDSVDIPGFVRFRPQVKRHLRLAIWPQPPEIIIHTHNGHNRALNVLDRHHRVHQRHGVLGLVHHVPVHDALVTSADARRGGRGFVFLLFPFEEEESCSPPPPSRHLRGAHPDPRASTHHKHTRSQGRNLTPKVAKPLIHPCKACNDSWRRGSAMPPPKPKIQKFCLIQPAPRASVPMQPPPAP